MSDETWCDITFAKKDKEWFRQIVGREIEEYQWREEDDLDQNHTKICIEDIEGGGMGISDKLQMSLFIFKAAYGATSSFNAGAIACYRDQIAEVQVDSDRHPVVEVFPSGEVGKMALSNVKEYFSILTKIDNHISEKIQLACH